MFQDILSLNNKVESFLSSYEATQEVILYGAGFAMPHMLSQLTDWGVNVVAVCDKDELKQGREVAKGVMVRSFNECQSLFPSALYVISSTQYFWEIQKELLALIPAEYVCDIDFECSHYFIGSQLKQLIIDNQPLVNRIYNNLSDELSQEAFIKVLAAHVSGDKSRFEQACTGVNDWYHFESIIKPQHGAVLLDCGAFDGDTIELFASASGGNYGHIYAIEPVPEVADKFEKRVKQSKLDNVTLYRKGVSDEQGVIQFVSNGMYSVMLSPETQPSELDNVVEVEVSTIDKMFEDIKLNTIKMDIEGAEYKALLGAQKVIQRDQPDLAICLYHCAEDFIRIPELLMELVPDYQLYIRHQSTGCTDTILFARKLEN